MGRKGDLLELIDGAPMGVHTLTGSMWKWTHHERSRRANEALAHQSNANVSTATLSFGGPPEETTDEHLRVLVAPPDRWHIESESRVDIRDGLTRWIGHPKHITELSQDDTVFSDTDVGLLIYPGAQFQGALRFDDPVEDEVAGRRCWKVDATAGLGRHAMRMFPISLPLGGIDHTFWFDGVTGIVLRHVGIVDDEPWSITEFKEVRVNPPLTDLDFQFVAPPDGTVERQIDQWIRMAESRGVDLTGVDREDMQAVQEAVHSMMLPNNQPTPEARLAMQKAKHVPVGDPPEDETAARESIEYVFNHLGETDEDGEALVNVQGGRNLAGPLSQAQKRVPGAGDNPASLIVDDIKFLRPDEAVVWFSVEVNGERFPMVNGREGRVVKVGERWLIEHATIADLLGFAGVNVAPPNE
jgi:hypothetical protein